jgi:hypothetical protein
MHHSVYNLDKEQNVMLISWTGLENSSPALCLPCLQVVVIKIYEQYPQFLEVTLD